MELRDGFIVGIFNYCDRWCETCAFTSHCRVFADAARAEAAGDPNMKALVDAPPLPEDVRPTPAWMQELIDELNEAADEAMARDEPKSLRPEFSGDHERLNDAAHHYARRAHEWLSARDGLSIDDPSDPRAVVGWFHALIAAKVYRALAGVADDEPEAQSDADGSAKVALLGIDRSRAAWTAIARTGAAAADEVAPFLADLAALAEQIERVFPHARAFIRPAFDEPDAVARMRAAAG